ncbi:hypothetical protein RZS08_57355, partial [Arthrospira platensis SPKY1]|nr:hypothetical protein [Arthrospira platensis SPKY1]
LGPRVLQRLADRLQRRCQGVAVGWVPCRDGLQLRGGFGQTEGPHVAGRPFEGVGQPHRILWGLGLSRLELGHEVALASGELAQQLQVGLHLAQGSAQALPGINGPQPVQGFPIGLRFILRHAAGVCSG